MAVLSPTVDSVSFSPMESEDIKKTYKKLTRLSQEAQKWSMPFTPHRLWNIIEFIWLQHMTPCDVKVIETPGYKLWSHVNCLFLTFPSSHGRCLQCVKASLIPMQGFPSRFRKLKNKKRGRPGNEAGASHHPVVGHLQYASIKNCTVGRPGNEAIQKCYMLG